MRHCDGSDPNLIMYVDPTTGKRLIKSTKSEVQKPCDCGHRFDDVKYTTIYPHRVVR